MLRAIRLFCSCVFSFNLTWFVEICLGLLGADRGEGDCGVSLLSDETLLSVDGGKWCILLL